MGSLKDEMRSPIEDHQHREMTEDGKNPSIPDTSSISDEPQISVSQLPISQEDRPPKPCVNADDVEEGVEEAAVSRELRGDEQTDSTRAEDSIQTGTMPQTQHLDTDPASPVKPPDVRDEEAASTQSTHDELLDALRSTDVGSEVRGEPAVDEQEVKVTECDTEKVREGQPLSSVQEPSAPGTPAPFGQQHIRTQVSLEVVQCQSVATSPMTPPVGGQAFSFPSTSGNSAGAETKDAESQSGRQVEYRSVATAPMTPKTPTLPTAFPEIHMQLDSCVESGSQNEDKAGPVTESFPASTNNKPKDVAEGTDSKSFTSTENSLSTLPTEPGSSKGTIDSSKQQCPQLGQRMGSMDQDITILVTQHDSTEAEDEEGEGDTALPFLPLGQEVAKVDENEELGVTEVVEKAIEIDSVVGKMATIKHIPKEKNNDGKYVALSHTPDTPVIISTKPQNKIEGPSIRLSKHPQAETDTLGQKKQSQMSAVAEAKEEDVCDGSMEPRGTFHSTQVEGPPTSPLAPNSPAPFGHHHVRTQVSLEVVQCHSVATSPMTPPDGEQAFSFPYSPGSSAGTETKEAEMQTGHQVEFRSVATGPMTPRTPTAPTGFPDIRKEEEITEMTEERSKGAKEITSTEKTAEDTNKVSTPETDENKTAKEETVERGVAEREACHEKSEEKCEEKCEEPVQDVSWDEKGMTWEVYGAVVEVAVLGSAIQKHLEKQVKKHKKQPSLPPPPPLSPSAVPLTPTSSSAAGSAQGSSSVRKKRGGRDGKLSRRRRNPFRLMLQNIQQPHCCSRAHATE